MKCGNSRPGSRGEVSSIDVTGCPIHQEVEISGTHQFFLLFGLGENTVKHEYGDFQNISLTRLLSCVKNSCRHESIRKSEKRGTGKSSQTRRSSIMLNNSERLRTHPRTCLGEAILNRDGTSLRDSACNPGNGITAISPRSLAQCAC
eukprot:6105662-Amphidinium_carterae.1